MLVYFIVGGRMGAPILGLGCACLVVGLWHGDCDGEARVTLIGRPPLAAMAKEGNVVGAVGAGDRG